MFKVDHLWIILLLLLLRALCLGEMDLWHIPWDIIMVLLALSLEVVAHCDDLALLYDLTIYTLMEGS